MTKVFVMATCPDCTQVKAQLAGNPAYELIDIITKIGRASCRERV